MRLLEDSKTFPDNPVWNTPDQTMAAVLGSLVKMNLRERRKQQKLGVGVDLSQFSRSNKFASPLKIAATGEPC
jgi:hypothetical protein